MNWSGNTISVQLYAYNEDEILHLYIRCIKSDEEKSALSSCSLRDPR